MTIPVDITAPVADPTAAPPPKLAAYDLKQAIATRYEPPEWHLESEVTLAGRRLDVVALNLWSSRAFRVVGFEIKVTRGDWLRELSAFHKAEEWTAVVDAFYVVTPPKLVHPDEVPAGWGHLELCGSRLMTRRHAAVREGATTLPREVAARFIGRLAQRASQEERTAEHMARAELRQQIEDKVRKQVEAGIEHERAELTELRTGYRELFDVLGLNHTTWRAHEQALRAAGIFAKATAQPADLRARLERFGAELGQQSAQLLEASRKIAAAGEAST